MMNILFVNFGIYKRGGWGRTFMLARGLSKEGHNITILTTSEKKGIFFDVIKSDGVKIVKFNDILPLKLLSKGFGFLSFINRMLYSICFSFDIVHADSHRPNAYYPCVVNRCFHKSKFFIEWWDNFGPDGQLRNKHKWFKLFLGRWETKTEISSKILADGVVVLSEFMYRRAMNVGIDKNKIKIIHGGANVEYIRYLPLNASQKEKINLELDTVTFGFLGSGDSDISELKPFLNVIKELKDRFKFKFINFGIPFSSKKKEFFGIENLVIEGGWIDYFNNNESTVLAAVDVFILIKKDDVISVSGWPNKFGDYLACGRPILLNPYGDIINFIKKYNPGVILVQYNNKDIHQKIINICMGKYDLNTLGSTNRQLAENYLSWDHKAKQLEMFYAERIN